MAKSLKDATKELKISFPFMSGRTKEEQKTIHGQVVTITDYGFLSDRDHDYIVYIVKEDAEHFYFGGQVLTDQVHKLEDQGFGDAIRKEGLPVMFASKKGKNNRFYTDVVFFPEG